MECGKEFVYYLCIFRRQFSVWAFMDDELYLFWYGIFNSAGIGPESDEPEGKNRGSAALIRSFSGA